MTTTTHLQITGPYYVEKPRYAGHHWTVTIRTAHGARTHRFADPDAAEAFAQEWRV